jgi:hypothetical protein
MRFRITLPFSIRDANRVTEAFAKHLEAGLMEARTEPTMVVMVVARETLPESRGNDADTIFVESLGNPAGSEELTFLSIAMVRTFKELPMHGFTLRTEPTLGIAA